jgi:hypothetical protein
VGSWGSSCASAASRKEATIATAETAEIKARREARRTAKLVPWRRNEVNARPIGTRLGTTSEAVAEGAADVEAVQVVAAVEADLDLADGA